MNFECIQLVHVTTGKILVGYGAALVNEKLVSWRRGCTNSSMEPAPWSQLHGAISTTLRAIYQLHGASSMHFEYIQLVHVTTGKILVGYGAALVRPCKRKTSFMEPALCTLNVYLLVR